MNVQFYEASTEERKNNMVECLNNTYGALMFYYDNNGKIKTCAMTEKGYESNVLELLNAAVLISKQAIEEVVL